MAERGKREARSKNATDMKGPLKKEYTDEEAATIASWSERSKRTPLKFAAVKTGAGKLTMDAQEARESLALSKLSEALGTPDFKLQSFLLNQVVQTFRWCQSSKDYDVDQMAESCNLAMAILQGIAPRDEIEGLLAVQMIGVHNLAMETMRRAMISDQTFEGIQADVNNAAKLSRTFTAQMDALKKYRTGGEQKVTVTHVHVNEGGRAIVGTVTQRGGGSCDKKQE